MVVSEQQFCFLRRMTLFGFGLKDFFESSDFVSQNLKVPFSVRLYTVTGGQVGTPTINKPDLLQLAQKPRLQDLITCRNYSEAYKARNSCNVVADIFHYPASPETDKLYL